MKTESTITFPTEAGTAGGHLVRSGRNAPGVVVIQEWWGLVPHVKDVAGRFADQGYTALAPDLYHGMSTVEAEEAAHLMKELNWDRAVTELAGAVRYLRDVEGAPRVGVAGFCMGGALTILAAAQPGVDAYAAFYGFPAAAQVPADRITAPGMIFFGDREEFFPVPDAEAFAAAQRARGREAEVVIYPGAGHAFFNNERPEVYRAEAARDAWQRTLDLFGRHLRG